MTTQDFLEMHKAFNGYVVPIKDKRPDPAMCRSQRGTKAWKHHPDSYFNRPATEAEVREWASEGLGIGMIAGRSGAVVLEIDSPEIFVPMLGWLSKLPTATASTPGGVHVFFKASPAVGNQDFSCPLFNDPASPCYCGRNHLASLRTDSEIAVLPPAENREWLLSPKEVGFAEMPDGLLDLCESFRNIKRRPRSEEEMQDPEIVETQVEGAVLLDFDVRPDVRDFITSPNSPLISALVRDLGGQGHRVHCPYHPPDSTPSATLFLGRSGWSLVDHHASPAESVMLSQLGADRITGYLDRRAAGEAQHRHLVSRQVGRMRKGTRESWVWLALLAEEVGIAALPPSKLPDKLEGYSQDGLRLMVFIERWDQGFRYVFGSEVFPLAKTWLISVVFALPSSGGQKPQEWAVAYREVDRTLWHSRHLKILERVAKGKAGYGGTAALYRLLGEGGGDS